MRGWLWAAALLVALMGAPVSAKTFRWASDGDVRSLDPYAGRETFLRSFDANIYEPLVRRGRDFALEPALATNWSNPAPDRWRFKLRQGVVFQDGTPFSAADAVFSFARARAPTSKLAEVVAPIKEVRQIDDHTIDIVTNGPDPILPDELTEWGIMSRAWCEAHDATEPAERGHGEESYATDHANGTGPFMLAARTPEVETVLVPNPRWWDERHFDLDKAVFLPVPDDEVRVAELVSGKLDMIYAVPPQDIDRIARTPRASHRAGAGAPHHLFGLRPTQRRACRQRRQGPQPLQGPPRPRGLLSRDRRERNRRHGDARPCHAIGADGGAGDQRLRSRAR